MGAESYMSVLIAVSGKNFSMMVSDKRMVKFNEGKKDYIIVNEDVMIGMVGDPFPLQMVLSEFFL